MLIGFYKGYRDKGIYEEWMGILEKKMKKLERG